MGLSMWLRWVSLQRSTETTATGFCVTLDVTQSVLEMDHLTVPSLNQPDLTLISRQQPLNLKSLPQFSALVKTPAFDDGCSFSV